jgi:hypothetical protein
LLSVIALSSRNRLFWRVVSVNLTLARSMQSNKTN